MRRVGLAVMVALGLALAGAGWVWAQAGPALLLRPLAIDVVHEEPVTVTVAVPIEGGEPVTATSTITIGVALRVTVFGPDVVTVERLTPAAAQVSTAALAVDAAGRSYEVETGPAVELLQVQSGESSMGLTVIGELRNAGTEPLEYASIVVSLYDAAGTLIGVDSTFPELEPVQPGVRSPFRLLTQVDPATVASYVVQVE